MATMAIHNLHKSFGPTRVLDDITLDVQDGEFLAVVGPSGCGKSTLLRIIAGLERQTSGHVVIDQRVVDRDPPNVRNMGMVFQNYALYPHMSVFDNLAFGMMARRVPKQEIRKRVTEVAELLGIETYLKDKPKILSGGQRQRVAMGRALVRDPKAFLMDEPLSNLDALLRERMRIELRHLHERLRIPTLYVTHDQTEAMTLSDRIAVMKDGKLLQVGTPEDVYHRPATDFVAKFLGSPPMNVVAVQIDGRGRMAPIESPDASVPIPDLLGGGALGADASLYFGFRPESVGRHAGGHYAQLPVIVDAVETLGSRYHVHGHWGREPIILVMDEREGWTRGSTIQARVSWNDVHWFDKTTGQRIDNQTRRTVNVVGARYE